MKIAMFYHSLLSDWNHGNAHFLRGVVTELIRRGHEVQVFEPLDGWSLTNLLQDQGDEAVEGFRRAYPHLDSIRYAPESLDLSILDGVDLVIVHEWNDHDLVARIGEHRRRAGFRLLFHDTHHRSVTDRASMARYALESYDGVLAYGGVIRDLYLTECWARSAWTWHEAADTRVFRPLPADEPEGDLVWIGNWGDDERGEELNEFLLGPIRRLGLRARVHGVRYPAGALDALRRAGVEYGGYLPNALVPEVFGRYRFTVHVPRRPYARALPGIPTIRVFEALACGIPLICAPWKDAEGLFSPGKDYLVARDGDEMAEHMRRLMDDPALARQMAASGLHTIQNRHTCRHRVEQLLAICRDELGLDIDSPTGEPTHAEEVSYAPQP